MENIQASIKTAWEANDCRGIPTGDICSVVQSIMYATLDQLNLKKNEKSLSGRQVATALGLPLTTYQQTVKSVKDERLALDYCDRNTVFSQVVKSRG